MFKYLSATALFATTLTVLTLVVSAEPPAAEQHQPGSQQGSDVVEPEVVDDPDELLELPDAGDDVDAYLHLPPPTRPGQIRDLALSEIGVCVSTHGGRLHCRSFPGEVVSQPVEGRFFALAGGDRHFCALDEKSRPICWGDDEAGQAKAPEKVMIDVAAGATHSCGITAEGEPTCWGELDQAHRNPPAGPFSAIVASGGRTCAFGARTTSRCWGVDSPRRRPFRAPLRTLAMSTDAICAIDIHHRPSCRFDELRPTSQHPPALPVADLAVGRGFVCTLDPLGAIECVGPRAPRLPDEPPAAFLLAAGQDRVCAASNTGALHCWNRQGAISLSD